MGITAHKVSHLVQSVLFGIIRRIILDKELEEGDWWDGLSVHSPGETRKFPLHEQFLKMVYVVVCQNRLARLLFLCPSGACFRK